MAPAASAETVTVACKLPAGLRADIRDKPSFITLNDGRKELIAGPIVAQHTFRGSAEQRRMESDGQIIGETSSVVAGFGLTRVPKDFADKWFEENADYAPVKAGLIFALPKLDSVRDKAKDHKEIRNGLEPVDPNAKVRDASGAVIETIQKDD